jgi:hypothetical protein
MDCPRCIEKMENTNDIGVGASIATEGLFWVISLFLCGGG